MNSEVFHGFGARIALINQRFKRFSGRTAKYLFKKCIDHLVPAFT